MARRDYDPGVFRLTTGTCAERSRGRSLPDVGCCGRRHVADPACFDATELRLGEKIMSRGHEGRHRIADDEHVGRHRDAPVHPRHESPEGRHRGAGVDGRRAATPMLVTASGAAAVTAMTVLVLAGQGESLGRLFPDRPEEPRPSATSSTSRGGPAADADLAGYAPGFDATMGNNVGGGLWGQLFPEEAASSSQWCDGVPGVAQLWANGCGAGIPTGGRSGTDAPIPGSTAASPAGFPGAGTQTPAGPGPAPQPSGTTAPRSTAGGPPAGPVDAPPPGPAPRPAQPVTEVVAPVPEPVAKVAEPVTAPTTRAAEPVTKVAEPVPEPVAKVVEPVPKPVTKPVPEPVTKPVPEPVTKVVPEPVTKVEPVPEPTTTAPPELPPPPPVPSVQLPG